MMKNVGNTDQTVRLIVGSVPLSLMLMVNADWRWLGLIGLIPVMTAILRVCPLYTILGINTCDKETTHV
jgi:hypothetical protein